MIRFLLSVLAHPLVYAAGVVTGAAIGATVLLRAYHSVVAAVMKAFGK